MVERGKVVNRFSVLLSIGLIVVGCSAHRPPTHTVPGPVEIIEDAPAVQPPVAPEPLFFTHTVHWPNETLPLVAKWYTGSEKNWPLIARENPALKPNRLAMGDDVSIPVRLLTSRNAMPRSFVPAPVPAHPKPPQPSEKPLQPPPAPELYGPIESDQPLSEPDDNALYPTMN